MSAIARDYKYTILESLKLDVQKIEFKIYEGHDFAFKSSSTVEQ